MCIRDRVKPDNTVSIVEVKTGATVGDITALTGISPGDNVVLSGQSRLTQGAKVAVTQADHSQHLALGSN